MNKININMDYVKTLEREKEQNSFAHKRDSLNNRIKQQIKDSKNGYEVEILQQVLEMEDSTEDELELKEWLYNNGNIRTASEIDDHNKKVDDEIYYTSGQYNKDMHSYWFLPFLPAIIWGLCIWYGIKQDADCLVITFLTTPLWLAACCLIGVLNSKRRKSLADEHNVPKNDKKYIRESFNAKTGTATVIGSTLIAGKHAKDDLKQTINPDTWHELK